MQFTMLLLLTRCFSPLFLSPTRLLLCHLLHSKGCTWCKRLRLSCGVAWSTFRSPTPETGAHVCASATAHTFTNQDASFFSFSSLFPRFIRRESFARPRMIFTIWRSCPRWVEADFSFFPLAFKYVCQNHFCVFAVRFCCCYVIA